MKVNIEIECTPAEARQLVGLPDLAPVQDRYVARLAEMTEGRIKPEAIEALIRSWAPIGETGLGLWKSLLEGGMRKDKPD